MPDQLDKFTTGKTKSQPRIYAYKDPAYPGLLKVGFTSRKVEDRVAEQYPTKRPDGKPPYKIVFQDKISSAIFCFSSNFLPIVTSRLPARTMCCTSTEAAV